MAATYFCEFAKSGMEEIDHIYPIDADTPLEATEKGSEVAASHGFHMLRVYPSPHKRREGAKAAAGAASMAPPISGRQKPAPRPSAPVKAPTVGATAKVWEIAGQLAKGRGDRAKVLEACEKAGIHPATAKTQWSRFAKAQGF